MDSVLNAFKANTIPAGLSPQGPELFILKLSFKDFDVTPQPLPGWWWVLALAEMPSRSLWSESVNSSQSHTEGQKRKGSQVWVVSGEKRPDLTVLQGSNVSVFGAGRG